MGHLCTICGTLSFTRDFLRSTAKFPLDFFRIAAYYICSHIIVVYNAQKFFTSVDKLIFCA
nr:MAG TPA: hypothetical protein [Caudoviricetes sp.]